MIGNNTFKLKTFNYDVATEGGAVGVIRTGVFFAGLSISGLFIGLKVGAAFTAAPGALISCGTFLNPVAMFGASNFTITPVNVWQGLGAFYTAAPQGEEIILTITIGAYLTGKVTCSIMSIETNQ
jgi:hypothetical protein